ncbi:hypothetical protein C0J52_23918 [Blattella germanica]|nr:hypothetical protein C0J52_23918 [Blattella germanica]
MSDSKGEWTRPKSVHVPQVWREWVGLKKMEDGKIPSFRIQDVPETMHEEMIEFMTKHFIRDEVLNECLNLKDDAISLREMQGVWREMLKQNVSIAAFMDEGRDSPGKLAGCNIIGVTKKTDAGFKPEMFEGRCIRIIVRDLEYASHLVNVFEKYGVEEYMTAMGLCVDPVFRGQGLGLEILKARFDLGKAVGLKVTQTAFTGMASQKLAHKVGFEVLTEVPYEDFKENGQPVYPGIKCKTLKIMTKKIE